MPDPAKAENQLIAEIAALRQQIAELQRGEASQAPALSPAEGTPGHTFPNSEANSSVSSHGSPLILYTTDEQGRYTWIQNPPYGFSAEQILGKRDDELFPAEDVAELIAFKRQVLDRQVGARRELQVRHEGKTFFFDVSAEPLRGPDGQLLGLMVAALDITSHRQAEQQLQELNETLERRVAERTATAEQRAAQLRVLAAELTQAEQRERRRVAQVLHDHLQQLLVGAKLQLALLQRQPLDAALLEPLQQVVALLDESIQVSRSLTVELSPPVLYEGGLAQALDWLAHWMQEKHGLVVKVEADETADPEAEDLRVLLFQAVRELLFNIVKHAGVDRATVRLRSTQAGYIQIQVIDAGVGFDPSRLWTRAASNGGLGLFSIRERLEFLGGGIRIESALGQGTCVTLDAPLHLASDRASDSGSEPAPQKIRVLLADDHELLRHGLAGLLRRQADLEVVGEAADGQTAVELTRRLQPDVVVMDVAMPQLDGVEATRQILAVRPGTRVIGFSMHDEPGLAAAMQQAGAVAYLTKGSPSKALIASIRASVAKRDKPRHAT